MALAIFDLDNTLIAGDSDHSWGQFLCAEGLVDAQRFSHDNDRFYQDYQEGRLDIYAYLRFALAPLTGRSIEEVARLQQQFMRDWVEPMLLPAAFELLDKHRNRGDELVIITASNTVVTGPIAERLGVATLMGCDTEIVGGKYTGQPTGVPSFQEGKVTRLQDWLATTGHSLTGAWFYSDSHNDLPLLERVDNPVATDPDPQLAAVANDRGWPIISLR
ncbi:MAG: HAD-IB family hydrolase [Proteobacteria bacterium]|jgi:HAD superfamily hydrolase (TIGR01490 family)|nr:HAD-IB family hydrolase [Pseudomonadota bacterium]